MKPIIPPKCQGSGVETPAVRGGRRCDLRREVLLVRLSDPFHAPAARKDQLRGPQRVGSSISNRSENLRHFGPTQGHREVCRLAASSRRETLAKRDQGRSRIAKCPTGKSASVPANAKVYEWNRRWTRPACSKESRQWHDRMAGELRRLKGDKSDDREQLGLTSCGKGIWEGSGVYLPAVDSRESKNAASAAAARGVAAGARRVKGASDWRHRWA